MNGWINQKTQDDDAWTCDGCGEEFELTKKEQKELDKKGKIKIKCPHCGINVPCEYIN